MPSGNSLTLIDKQMILNDIFIKIFSFSLSVRIAWKHLLRQRNREILHFVEMICNGNDGDIKHNKNSIMNCLSVIVYRKFLIHKETNRRTKPIETNHFWLTQSIKRRSFKLWIRFNFTVSMARVYYFDFDVNLLFCFLFFRLSKCHERHPNWLVALKTTLFPFEKFIRKLKMCRNGHSLATRI